MMRSMLPLGIFQFLGPGSPDGLQTSRPSLYQGLGDPAHAILIRAGEVLNRRLAVHAREEKGRQERGGPRFQNVGRLPRDAFQISFAQYIEAAEEIGGCSRSP